MSAPPTNRRLLTVERITLSFSGVVALDGVSLDVDEGELIAVIGPNGAGKTSLFNCISGLYRPQQGVIRLRDRDLRRDPVSRRASLGVARMFQNLALYEHLTTLENLMIGRHQHFRARWWQDLLRLPSSLREEVRHRQHVERLIDFLDLEPVRHHPVGVLPYGVLKRIELGRALAMEPALLLLDEPAAGLNQEETEDMARYLLDIQEELGVTQVLIEHDLHFVMDLANRVTVLDFGRVIAQGTPEEVRAHPAVIAAYTGGA